MIARALAVLMVATSAALAVPVSSADAPLDAAAIREKMRAAVGARLTAFRETDETTRSDGSTTIEHDFVNGDDYRYSYDNGRFHTENGVYHKDAWHMNDNGQVVLDAPDPGEASGEDLATVVTPIHTPVEGYLLATLNARGHGVKEYVDGESWQIVRLDDVTPNGTIVRTYDDVRADHGRTFPHHIHVDNGYARTTSDLRVTEYGPADVPQNEVEIPKPRRALVEFPAGISTADLPVRFGRSNVYVRVMINGRGLDFVLDTGAAEITIDSTVARELGLPEYRKQSAVTAGRYTTARTIVPEMRIGTLVMKDVAVQEVPHGWIEDPEVKTVGLLGFDFLAELGVTLDYEHSRVTAVPGASYSAPVDQHTIPLDVRVGDGQPLATVTLNGAIGERWVIDTGAVGTFLVFDYFARRHPEALRDLGGGGADRFAQLAGIGGAIQARPYQIGSLKVANVDFRGFVGYRVTGSGSFASDQDGLIGADFLRLFTLGFDYGNSRVYLVPNSRGRTAMGIK